MIAFASGSRASPSRGAGQGRSPVPGGPRLSRSGASRDGSSPISTRRPTSRARCSEPRHEHRPRSSRLAPRSRRPVRLARRGAAAVASWPAALRPDARSDPREALRGPGGRVCAWRGTPRHLPDVPPRDPGAGPTPVKSDHPRLVLLAVRWARGRTGGVVLAEPRTWWTARGQCPDVLAWPNPAGRRWRAGSVLVEAKASRADFL